MWRDGCSWRKQHKQIVFIGRNRKEARDAEKRTGEGTAMRGREKVSR